MLVGVKGKIVGIKRGGRSHVFADQIDIFAEGDNTAHVQGWNAMHDFFTAVGRGSGEAVKHRLITGVLAGADVAVEIRTGDVKTIADVDTAVVDTRRGAAMTVALEGVNRGVKGVFRLALVTG